jgi:hypothetical protein
MKPELNSAPTMPARSPVKVQLAFTVQEMLSTYLGEARP